jgi:hypothetical protein
MKRVRPCQRLDRRQLGHLDRHFAPVLAHGEFFGKQGVDGFDGADFAAFEAAQGARGIFRQTRLVLTRSTTEEALIASPPGCEAVADGRIEVQRATHGVAAGARQVAGSGLPCRRSAEAGELAMRRIASGLGLRAGHG